MSGPGAVLRSFIRCRVSGPACRCARPSPDPVPPPEPERRQVPDLFGPAQVELRAALACYDLVDEIVRADGDGPTEGDRRAHVLAGCALACAAGRLDRAHHQGVDYGETGGAT